MQEMWEKYPEGASVCTSCNISLEQCDKENQEGFPVGIGIMGILAAATAYGIPVVKASMKDN